MRLYNTLSRSKEDFRPIAAGKVKLYTCGPTVYDYAHIGNLRNVVFNDTLRRVLEAGGYKVHHVMNITDVGHLVSDADEGEDKLEKGARREGKSVWDVAEHYIKAFKDNVDTLNVLKPTQLIRATDTIPAQVELVQTLLDKGFAYQTEQAIYFDVTKLADYGKLSGQKLAEKEVGVRDEVVTDPNKKHPQDFAVWFFAVGHFAEHEMRWPTPWGEGFPGWHLECSAIIHESLGEPIDIHTGGVDHIGTHHTNEIAQSEAAFDKPLANYWVHNEFLQVSGGKMAKSDGNLFTLSEVVERGFDPMALRLLYLQAHYRTQQNFTWDALEAAQNLLKELQAWADRVHQESGQDMPNLQEQLLTALQDDLATPRALAHLTTNLATAPSKQLLEYVDKLFGLQLAGRPDVTPEQKAVIAERESARKAKDFAAADAARDALLKEKIEIDDTAAGPRWRRVSEPPKK